MKYVNAAASAVGGGDDDGEDEFEKTMIIRPGSKGGGPSLDSVNKAVAGSGGGPVNPDAQKGLPKAKLQVLSGAFSGKELELNKALTTLGRPGVQVAAITRRAEGFFVVPVEGDSGKPPQVNDEAVGKEGRKLKHNDVIELAGVKMGFFEV